MNERVRRRGRSRLLEAACTILAQREHFATTADWLVRWWDGLLRRAPRLRFLTPRPVWHVRVRGWEQPIVLRKASKDWVALRETLFEDEYGLLEGHVREAPRTILDLGANIGLSVRVWLRRFPQARIVAVEPDPENFEICRLNVSAADSTPRVHLCRCCVAAGPGNRFLDRSTQPMEYRTLSRRTPESIEVRAKTVDDILRESGLGQVDLLKCDVEGAEVEIFRDCHAWISNVSILLVELHPPYDHTTLVGDLERNGTHPRTLARVQKGSGTELALLELSGAEAGLP